MNATARTTRLRTIARRETDLDIEHRQLLARKAKLEAQIANNREEATALGKEGLDLLDEIHPASVFPVFKIQWLEEAAARTAKNAVKVERDRRA